MLQKTLLATLALVLYCLPTNAQIMDTIKVDFSPQAQLQYIFDNPKDFKTFEKANIDSLTQSLSMRVGDLSPQLDTTLVLENASTSSESEVKQNQFIEISPLIGASLVRSSFVPDYGIRMSIGIRKTYTNTGHLLVNKRLHQSFYAEYQNMLFFEPKLDNGFQQFGNGFLNVGYSRNEDHDDSNFGLSLGYLVRPQGSYFGDNTMKFEFHMPVYKNVAVSPFIIATDNFTSVFPGIRLSVL